MIPLGKAYDAHKLEVDQMRTYADRLVKISKAKYKVGGSFRQ